MNHTLDRILSFAFMFAVGCGSASRSQTSGTPPGKTQGAGTATGAVASSSSATSAGTGSAPGTSSGGSTTTANPGGSSGPSTGTVSSTSGGTAGGTGAARCSGFAPQVKLAVGSSPSSVVIGDLDGDGIPDLAVSNMDSQSVSILLGQGQGAFGNQTSIAAGPEPLGLAAADLNGDGRLDLALTELGAPPAQAVGILWGAGEASFAPLATFPAGLGAAAVVVADFNGDGRPDLAVANQGDGTDAGTVSILLGNADAGFLPPSTLAVGVAPTGLAIGDFNEDLVQDVAVTNYLDGTVSVLLGLADGGFVPQALVEAGDGPAGIAAADFNGDGHLDLAVALSGTTDTSNTVSVLFGDGHGGFDATAAYVVGIGPSAVGVGDFNQDGHPDLAVANSAISDNSVSILLATGDGGFQPQVVYPVGQWPQAIAVADLNGDGVPDLVTANWLEATVSVLLGGVCP